MQDHNKIIKDIKRKEISPFYLLSGLEPFFIDSIASEIVNELINDDAKDFDYTILYGKDTTVNQIIEVSKRYPMIAEFHLIIIREAQYLEKKYDELVKYILNPQKKSVVVFCYKNKSFDKKSKIYKAATKFGVVFDSKLLYENQLENWILFQFKKDKLEVSPKSIQLMIEFLGLDLGKINQEIKKLKILSIDNIVTADMIEKNIGISKDYNNFELINAIGIKNKQKCLKIISYLSDNSKNNPIVLTISSLFQFFKKLLIFHGINGERTKASKVLGINPFFIKDYETASKHYNMKNCSNIIELIYKADLESKGVNRENQENILIDLINEIF